MHRPIDGGSYTGSRTYLEEEAESNHTQRIALLLVPDLLGKPGPHLGGSLRVDRVRGVHFVPAHGQLEDILLRLRVQVSLPIVLLDIPVAVEEEVVEHLLNHVVEGVEVRDEEGLVGGFLPLTLGLPSRQVVHSQT